MYIMYCISRNIGDIFNLVVWRPGSKSPNLHRPTYYALSLLCNCQIYFANIKLQPDLVHIAKFNDRQYFWMYGLYVCAHGCYGLVIITAPVQVYISL